MPTIYLDNDVASSLSRRERSPDDMQAIDALFKAGMSSAIKVVVSRHSDREMERAPADKRDALKAGISGLQRVTNDHVLHGIFNQSDPFGGFSVCPLVSDIPDVELFGLFQSLGLKKDDAQHLMYAWVNGADYFVTFDGGILSRTGPLEEVCRDRGRALRIRQPRAAAAELGI
jgi:hypothetical protein